MHQHEETVSPKRYKSKSTVMNNSLSMSLLGLEPRLGAKTQKITSMTLMKSCRPVVRNGYSTLQIRSISPQNAEKFGGLWDIIQSWCLRIPIQFHNGWLLHFSSYHIRFQIFVLSFHQLTAACNLLVTVGLGNTIKLPSQLQHSRHLLFYYCHGYFTE